MIPKWQWWAIGCLIAIALMLDVLTTPNSSVYFMLSGKCRACPVPAPCAVGRGVRFRWYRSDCPPDGNGSATSVW